MTLRLEASKLARLKSKIQITGSKSESNRLLLLQALFPEIQINNISNSDDSQLMMKALKSSEELVDIHHAGTAMRFLTAYFSIQEGRATVLTGSKRMKERPIKILVDALRSLGADISYLENEGYPPLKINGQALHASEVLLDANVSSQYISALLLVASKLNNGLKLTLNGKITSVPYIKMTLALLNELGIETSFEQNVIRIEPTPNKTKTNTMTVESDWSSASYFYSIVALSPVGTEIKLSAFKKNSLQGDSILTRLYHDFGVETHYGDNAIRLLKTSDINEETLIAFDLSDAPDIAQTIAVTCLGLGMSCKLSGLHTLKIKETDRIEALKTEITKLGGDIEVTENSLHLKTSNTIKANIGIDTYNDHRMAMAFAPLALKTSLSINDADVVSKSYPNFWQDLEILGFSILK